MAKTFTVTDIDGRDWVGTYAEFRAEVHRLSLPICPHCRGRKSHDHFCSAMASIATQSASLTPSGPVWHGD